MRLLILSRPSPRSCEKMSITGLIIESTACFLKISKKVLAAAPFGFVFKSSDIIYTELNLLAPEYLKQG